MSYQRLKKAGSGYNSVGNNPDPPEEDSSEVQFLMNFRKPKRYGGVALFKGNFGFDWLRPEHRYPTTSVNSKGQNILRSSCDDPESLKEEYLNGIPDEKRISPYGYPYYPAWISLMPAKGPRASNMHKLGVKLSIQLEFRNGNELEKFAKSQTTESITFKCPDGVSIHPEKISLKDFKNAERSSITISKNDSDDIKTLTLYDKIHVSCPTPARENRAVNVIREKTGLPCGQLVIYGNREVKELDLIVVKVDTGSGTTPDFKGFGHEDLIKNRGLNQALIRCEVKDTENFPLHNLPIKENDTDKKELQAYLLENINNGDYLTSDQNEWKRKKFNITEKLSTLYKYYGKYADDIFANHHKVVVFLLDYNVTFWDLNSSGDFITTELAGLTKSHTHTRVLLEVDFDPPQSDHLDTKPVAQKNTTLTITTDNVIVIFRRGLSDGTILHELGHSLGLEHTFPPDKKTRENTNHYFLRGSTDNHMDYDNNPYLFYKWQWDRMRKDKNLK